MLFFSDKRAKKILDEGADSAQQAELDRALSNRDGIISKVTNSPSLAPYIEQVKTLFSLIQDYVNGSYREIPWWSLGSIATTLLYILMPLDAIPDFIPLAGFLDDAVILKLCLDMIGKDLASYRESKSSVESIDEKDD
ncbi:MAG: YkvA family protein [Spongiibacteraceae bacterium]